MFNYIDNDCSSKYLTIAWLFKFIFLSNIVYKFPWRIRWLCVVAFLCIRAAYVLRAVLEPPPLAEVGGQAAGLTRGVPQGPKAGVVDPEAAAKAIDANAAIAADGAVLVGGREGVLAAGPLGRFGGELGGHAHHLGPGALPKAQG